MDLLDELQDKIDVHNTPAFSSSPSRTWKCKKCGKLFTTSLTNRTRNGTGCPYCQNAGVSYPEYLIYHYLLYSGYNDIKHREKIQV